MGNQIVCLHMSTNVCVRLHRHALVNVHSNERAVRVCARYICVSCQTVLEYSTELLLRRRSLIFYGTKPEVLQRKVVKEKEIVILYI